MKKIFFSYDFDRHANYKNIIKAWETTSEHFSFNDKSTDIGINSTNASYIKSVIKDKIDSSDAVFLIVGDYVSANRWVNWEIDYAISKFKRIVCVKIESHYTLPSGLDSYSRCMVYEGFNKNNIETAIRYS